MARPVPNVLEALGVWPAGPLGRLLRAGWSRLASGLARTLWLRATLALFGVYVVLLPAGLLVAGQQGQAAGAADRAARLGRVQVDLRALQTGVFEESAGLRGYIETTDARLLDQYDAGRARLGRAWASLAVDASGTVLERELPALRATSDAWQEWAARNRGTVVAAPR